MSAISTPTPKSGRPAALPHGLWTVDQERSGVAFVVKHMLFAKVNGRFLDFEGSIEAGPSRSRAGGTVSVASVQTGDAVRDERLRDSPDFFDAGRFPVIAFESTSIEGRAGGHVRLLGDLTIRGVTRPLELTGRAARTAGGGERFELELAGELDRRDFGLTWNQSLDTGGAVLGNTVKIDLRISAVRSETVP